MGKEFKHFPNINKYTDEKEVEEEDLPSDLEIQDEKYIDQTAEEINLVEELKKHTEKIRKEYATLLSKKGGNPNNWLETLTLTSDNIFDEELNIDDDMKRELAFYNMTTENVVKGILKLKEVFNDFIKPE